jgi:deoxyribonuclease V
VKRILPGWLRGHILGLSRRRNAFRECTLKRERINHAWNLSLPRAAELQTDLAARVLLTPLKEIPALAAGVDTAEWNGQVFAVAVVMDIQSGKVVEIGRNHAFARFSYVAGYLAFRHGPVVLKAIRQLDRDPGLFFFAGHGVCHPRLLGLASHLGLRIDRPSVGCSLERLVGHYDPPGPHRGDYSVVRFSPQAPGVVLRTQPGINPIFVSPGHRIDLLGAIEQTLRLTVKYRLPEPLRRAHIEAGRYMREYRNKERTEIRRGDTGQS